MRSLLVAAIVILVAAGSASAQTVPRVHEGLYTHVHFGVAYTRFSSDRAQLTVKGAGGTVDFAVGAAVRPNVIVFGELFDDIAISPTISYGGVSDTTSSHTSGGVMGLGVGVAYYLMPIDAYVAGTLAAAKVTVRDDLHGTGASELGPGVALKVGKEWTLGGSWSLGVGGQAFFGSMAEQDEPSIRYTAMAAALVLGVTRN